MGYLSALWKLGKFRNVDYIPTKTVLRPRYNVRDMILWDEVYCRFTPHDKDRHSASVFTQTQTQTASRSLEAHSPSQISVVGRGQAFSLSASVGVGGGGANRYHPRSPRMGASQSVMLKTAPMMSLDANVNANAQRTKPPPPMRMGKNGCDSQSQSQQKREVALAASETSDGFEEKTTAMLPSIQVEDEDEEEEEDSVGQFGDDYDSDSASVPEKVKRITMLQQKVSQLESILQEYRKRESARKEMDGDAEDEEDEYRLELGTAKGNIV